MQVFEGEVGLFVAELDALGAQVCVDHVFLEQTVVGFAGSLPRLLVVEDGDVGHAHHVVVVPDGVVQPDLCLGVFEDPAELDGFVQDLNRVRVLRGLAADVCHLHVYFDLGFFEDDVVAELDDLLEDREGAVWLRVGEHAVDDEEHDGDEAVRRVDLDGEEGGIEDG